MKLAGAGQNYARLSRVPAGGEPLQISRSPYRPTLRRAPSRPSGAAEDMMTAVWQFQRGYGALVIAVATAVTAAVYVGFGLSPSQLVIASLVVVITNVLPGVVLWRCVRPRDGWWIEDIGLGWGCSLGLSIVSAVIAGLTRLPVLTLLLPLAATGALLAVRPVRRRALDARCAPTPPAVGYTVGGVLLLGLVTTIGFVDQHKLSWGKTVGLPYSDSYLHLAISRSILERGPVSWPTVIDEPLGYHWFTHAWVAQIAGAGTFGIDVTLLRVLPLLAPVVVACAIVGAALRLTGSGAAAAIAVVLGSIGGVASMVGAPSGYLPVVPASPTVAMSVPPMVAVVTLIVMRWRGEVGSWVLPAIFAVAVVATGSKGSTTPLLLSGLAVVILLATFSDRSAARAASLDAAVLLLAVATCLVVVFHGSADALTWGPGERSARSSLGDLGSLPGQVVAVAYAIATGVAPAALGVVALVSGRVRRADDSWWLLWLLLGATVAGSTAGAVFLQPGGSQAYFVMSALPLAALASAVGARAILPSAALSARAWVVVGIVGLVGGFSVWVLPGAIGNTDLAVAPRIALQVMLVLTLVSAASAGVWLLTRRRAAVLLCVAVCGLGNAAVARTAYIADTPLVRSATYSIRAFSAVTQGQLDAARYIDDHSDTKDLVMTNRHCGTPVTPDQPCDSRRWVVTAFSGRQALIEAWGTTPTSAKLRPRGRELITLPYWNPGLLTLNDGFFARPNEASHRELWERGVRWVYVDRLLPHARDLAPFAQLRYRNDDASAWQLLPPGR